MPHVYGPIYRHVLDEARRRVLAGEKREDVASELELSSTTVCRYTVHLPQPRPTFEARRVQVLACLEAGLDERSTAEKVGCKISHVVGILRSARAAEPAT